MKTGKLPSQIENAAGLHKRYHIQKVVIQDVPPAPTGGDYDKRKVGDYKKEYLVDVDPKAEYFVLRLDEGGSDIEHIKACRIGIHAYADAISHHLPQLAVDLKERYPLLQSTK